MCVMEENKSRQNDKNSDTPQKVGYTNEPCNSRVVIINFDEGLSIRGAALWPHDADATGTDAQVTEEGRYVLLSYQTIDPTDWKKNGDV